ncbi:phage Gp37/Gp68 family protein [Roseococcus sp.]|uniref:phage Gp37/Gp68 family protein n=1 Tax=Roseococcus sp. TaxID=2109646 RepID=UPI003BAD51CE
MGADTKIEWADHTFNPWTGCQRVSPGCDHCYAEAQAKRNTSTFGAWGAHAERKRTSESYWRQPLKWNSEACKAGTRPRVFCASMADVFDNQVPESWRADLWNLIAATPHLDWLLLTKRPQLIAKMLPVASAPNPDYRPWPEPWPWRNVWLGTTVENQAEADRRIPQLLAVPAAKRFLSCEPLLGAVDLRKVQGPNGIQVVDSLRGTSRDPEWSAPSARIDWVICGGESGPGARPMHPDWARSLRDQCAAAGAPFFFKQWGDWKPICEGGDDWHDHLYSSNRKAREGEDQDIVDERYGRTCKVPTAQMRPDGRHFDKDRFSNPEAFGAGSMMVFQIGKKAAGRLLDGREHIEVPA